MTCEDGGMLRDDTPREERIGPRDLTAWPTAPGRALARTALAAGRGAARLGSWGAANLVLVLTAFVGGVVVVGMVALAAQVYESVVEADGLAGLDRPVLDAAVGLRSPGLDHAVTLYTDVGGPVGMPVLALLATVVMVVRWRSRTPLVLMVVAALGSLAMTIAGKDLVLRRIDSARGRTAVVGVGVLFVLTMGLSRVFLGHHWLTDVVAGWALGLAWAAVVVTAHRLHLTVRKDVHHDDGERDAGHPAGDVTAQARSTRG
jgi:membrane-associated phospholipid phosphatase